MKFDIVQELGLVARAVQAGEREGQPVAIVVAARDYETEIEDVWDAITNPERLPRWFLPVSGELRVGGRYQLQGNAGGQIQICVPPRQLAVTWEFGGGITWLEVELSALTAERPSPGAPGRTRLELRHIAPVGGEHWDKYGPGAVGIGWDLTLRGLGQHLTSGASIEKNVAMAWLGSEEGKRFMRGTGEAWARADIARGEPAEVARAKAARTIAFYTGEPVPDTASR